MSYPCVFLQTLPFDYANKYMSNLKDCFITLINSVGEYECMVKYSQNTYKPGRGWRNFVLENGLWKEDVLVFVPVGETGMDFEVEVFA